MIELKTVGEDDINPDTAKKLSFLASDESSINCKSLRGFQHVINSSDSEAILAMPSYQYQKGLRGWAKAHILASTSSRIQRVMPLENRESLDHELEKGWVSVKVVKPIIWEKPVVLTLNQQEINLVIAETKDDFDIEMIKRAKEVARSSNCYLDPAGCLYTRGKEVLIVAASTSFNHQNCKSIPVAYGDLNLNQGERMFFCDSLHAERVGISNAAESGISLQESTLYLTKFPCRSCAMSAIAAGVKSIVFDQGSYGLTEAADLFEPNGITLKRILG